ncbi:MAG: hypothetical protein ACOX2P_04410 [Bacillota bacterium]
MLQQDLCGLGDYEKLTMPLRESYENSLTLRRSLEKLEIRSWTCWCKSLTDLLETGSLTANISIP